ncbi:hypothetical protein ACFLU4_08855 [Chloroflexota bacterium]
MKKILLIDDEHDFTATFSRTLGAKAYRTGSASASNSGFAGRNIAGNKDTDN